MKKLFIILGALLFTTIIHLFMSNIITPSLITEGSIGIGGEKLSGPKLIEAIQLVRQISLISCIIFLTESLKLLSGCQVSEDKD